MNELYDIHDGLTLLSNRKKGDLLTWLGLAPLGAITAVLIVYGFLPWMAVIFAVVWAAYAFWVLTYVLYIRKRWNQRYHFLAKVEQFEPRFVEGEIVSISERAITNENMRLCEVRFADDVLFVESDKADYFRVDMKCRVKAVDGVIIGYEEIA